MAKHDAVVDTPVLTAQRMPVDAGMDQGKELLAQRVKDARWHGRHEGSTAHEPLRGNAVAGRVVPMQVGDVELLVEVTPVVGSEPTSKLDKAQEAVTTAFDRAQTAIVAVASSTVHVIGRMTAAAARPEQVEVTFGLKFSAQGNVVLAGASGEATLEVKLTYGHAGLPASGGAGSA